MTKKELIEALKDYPDDMEVVKYYNTIYQDGVFKGIVDKLTDVTTSYIVQHDSKDLKVDYIATRPCQQTKGAKKCIVL